MVLLCRAWQTWKRIARVSGDFFGRVVLTVLYFTLLAPFGLGLRLFGDPLATRPGRPQGWAERTTYDRTIDDARKQF